MAATTNPPAGAVSSMGIVFGDIGTSPIYTIGAILPALLPGSGDVLGAISLVIWTLLLVITVQYMWLAMQLGDKGEGGAIVLREILTRNAKPGIFLSSVSLLAILGVAFFIGDGVITPAISILSAVEGIVLLPGFTGTTRTRLAFAAILITTILFLFQRQGTGRVAWAFGPVMLLWFSALAVTGAISISSAPEIIFAINPLYGIRFLAANGTAALTVLAAVFLCATGSEALFADMGHLGRKPILKAWKFVFPAIVLSYLGQGAFALRNPEEGAVLFRMVFPRTWIYIYIYISMFSSLQSRLRLLRPRR